MLCSNGKEPHKRKKKKKNLRRSEWLLNLTSRQGLIAVNYPARDRGVGRFTDIKEAKKMCDNLICQHVATWREGEENWAYRDDPMVNTDKVSLDP